MLKVFEIYNEINFCLNKTILSSRRLQNFWNIQAIDNNRKKFKQLAYSFSV